jgi:hypothetical protein
VFDTVAGLISVLAVLLPGFVIADLQRSRRASTSSYGDWELVLRALSYSIVLHLVASPWTRSLVLKIESGDWQEHLGAIVAYGTVVIFAVPIVAGLLLNRVLLRAERKGSLRWWHYALGGRDARQAWDFMFQRLGTGAWLVIRLKDLEPGLPRVFGARYGKGSWASQSPVREHDLYLEEVWTVNDHGTLAARVDPRQRVWLSATQIDSLFVVEPPPIESA